MYGALWAKFQPDVFSALFCSYMRLFTVFVTIFSGFLLQSDRLNQVKTIETAHWDLVKGDCNRLIQLTVE